MSSNDVRDIVIGQEPMPVEFEHTYPTGIVTTEVAMLEIGKQTGKQEERDRVRTELIDWLVGRIDPKDAGLINGRRIVTEIDRICPKE